MLLTVISSMLNPGSIPARLICLLLIPVRIRVGTEHSCSGSGDSGRDTHCEISFPGDAIDTEFVSGFQNYPVGSLWFINIY